MNIFMRFTVYEGHKNNKESKFGERKNGRK
jgi:hypothetical protein